MENIGKNEFRLGTDNPVMIIKFIISGWCNYACQYCNYALSGRQRKRKFYTRRSIFERIFFRKKIDFGAIGTLLFKNSIHAFDNYGVEDWLAAFNKIPSDFIIEISGGEPFLDKNNFSIFMEGIADMEKCKLIRIDTNGFWDAATYKLSDKVKRKTVLNISYHPTQTSWESYIKRIAAMVGNNWKIGFINFVMEENQKDKYEFIRDYFEKAHGIFVNPNPDRWADKDAMTAELKKYFPEHDLMYKVSRKSPVGQRCYYPSITHLVQPTREVTRGCISEKPKNFLKFSKNLKALKEPIICPGKKCPCVDMYAFIENSGRGQQLDLLSEYANACKEYQTSNKLK